VSLIYVGDQISQGVDDLIQMAEEATEGTDSNGSENVGADTVNDQPNEKELSIVKERDGNKIAQEHGYKNAHEAKDNLGDSKVNIYKDKETGKYWLWNGAKGSEKSPL
jgi:hypothetical protein